MTTKKVSMFLLMTSVFVLLLGAGVNSNLDRYSLPLLHKVIYIDPGHGGRDSGTVFGKILEKDLNLQISKRLEKYLGERGAIVYMTRQIDEDLSSIYDVRKKRGDLYRRIQMISNKEKQVDAYLSIHINWYDNPYWSGAEVLYHSINPQNEILGKILMKHFAKDLKTTRTLKKTNLYMYKNITVAGVLIECGFLSNARERNLLQQQTYQDKIAQSITDSMIEYFSIQY